MQLAAAIILILVAGILSGLLLHGTFFNFILAVWFAAFVLFPTFIIVGGMALARLLRKGPIAPWQNSALIVWCAALVGLMLSLGTGQWIHQKDMTSARAYLERAIVVLDETKNKTGSYPKLFPAADIGRLPWLLHHQFNYNSDGKEFSMSYSDPSDMMAGYDFESSTRVWHRWH